MPPHDLRISVRSAWNGWETAEIRLADLNDIHWLQPTGAPKPLVHGYVSCQCIVEGQIPHDCPGTRPPHRVLVCVLKNHTIASVYTQLTRRADAAHAAGVKASVRSEAVLGADPPV